MENYGVRVLELPESDLRYFVNNQRYTDMKKICLLVQTEIECFYLLKKLKGFDCKWYGGTDLLDKHLESQVLYITNDKKWLQREGLRMSFYKTSQDDFTMYRVKYD